MPEHTPVPTPARSLYGFFMYFISKIVLVMYCLWAFAPDYMLHYFNIYYYPQKFWSTAIPIQCLVALSFFAFFIYPSLNFILTANTNDVNTIQDHFSNYNLTRDFVGDMSSNGCICENIVKCKYSSCEKSINYEHTVLALQDLNIRSVCEKLYNKK